MKRKHNLLDNHILGTVLVTESMTANDDRVGPARHQTWDILAQDRLTENGSAENVTNGSIRRKPHLLQLEFFNSLFIGRDSGTLDSDVVLQNGVSSIDGYLIVSLIAIGQAQVVVQSLNLHVWKNQLVLDELPDDFEVATEALLTD